MNMKRSHTALLLATIASSAIAAGAQAQVLPAPTNTYLRGAGATSIQNVLVQELNCIGGQQQLGNANGTLTTINELNFPSPTYTPAFNCDETVVGGREVQPNFSARYNGTGSGFGRQAWRLNTIQFDPITAGVRNAFIFNSIDTSANWGHVQFAFSDGGAAPADINAYNNGSTGASTLGLAPIQFPKYVLPVAVAYEGTRYGHNNSTNEDYVFNVTSPQTINGVAAGGLRMSRSTFCRVFNGNIVNFNDAAFTTDNGGTSLRDPDDALARWNSEGVPVRLIGRVEKSGTTDIFTRALAAQCNGISLPGGGTLTNRFTTNAESLPFVASPSVGTAPDFRSVRADTTFFPASSGPFAGTANNAVGNLFFNGTAFTAVSGGTTSAPTGANGSGLFSLADGSGGVRNAIKLAPDYLVSGSSVVQLNGKIGYIGSDFIAGSDSAISLPLFAAAVQNPSTSTFVMPSAGNAVDAFGTTVLPPESDANGDWLTGDTRPVRSAAGGTVSATRANPLAWYDVLYSTGATLANPTTGYPITGTTQFLGHRCYTAAQSREHGRIPRRQFRCDR
jgi:ABC-type phosphate transport system substrate-binding protein